MGVSLLRQAGPRVRSQAGTRQLGHRPVLDGLRGSAWAMVFVAHAGLVAGYALGQAAMFLFFGLSGFLISSLLIGEHARFGTISLRNFFARRALRLAPGLLLFLAAWLAVAVVFGRQPWVTTVPGGGPGAPESCAVALRTVGAGALYLTNWFDIFHLFSGFGPLGHLWSLAVEEQLYLVWAPLLALVLTRARRWALPLATFGALFSFFDVVVLHHAQVASSWVYRSTDTRMGAFLVGGALALAWSRRSAPSRRWPTQSATTALTALASVTTLVWASWSFDHPTSMTMSALAWVAASAAGPLLVLSLVDRPAPRRFSVLGGAVMGYLGRRSYALYLWHYPWLTWLRSFGLLGVAGALVATLASAEVSWHLVEAPMLARRRRFVTPGATVRLGCPHEAGPVEVRPVVDEAAARPGTLRVRGRHLAPDGPGLLVGAAEAV